MTGLTWTCHVCGRERPDEAISVHRRDRSVEWDMPRGSFVENVRYCNDRPACVAGVASKTLTPPAQAAEAGR